MTGRQAYLLAAGKGTRAGGPKAWLDCGGEPLLERQVRFLSSLIPPQDIAVSIQRSWIDKCRALNAGVNWVGVDPLAPPLASIQALLRAMPLQGWASVHHVDMPVWEPALFGLLAASLPSAGENAGEGGAALPQAIQPFHRGRRGHPVILSRSAGRALLELDPSSGRLDDWLRQARVMSLEVPYPCVLENWNQGVPR